MQRIRQRGTVGTESELVGAARAGDKRAFGELLTHYKPMMHAVVHRMITNDFFTDDVLQEASIHAFLSLDTLRDAGRFRSWLYGITRNVCLMFLRVQRIRSVSLDFLMDVGGEPASETPDPEEIAERLELRHALMRCLDRLSPLSRETVLLFYYEGFSLEEISALLAVSVTTVKGRLHRARQRMRDMLVAVETLEEGEDMMMPVTLVDVVMRETTWSGAPVKNYVLVLMSEEKRRAFTIWVGEYEGLAIAYKLNGYHASRPMTQTFMSRLIEASGATLERVTINQLKDDVYYATAYLNIDGVTKEIDARPSDAIGLALYMDAPLFVSEQVLELAGFDIPNELQANGRGRAAIQSMLEAETERLQKIQHEKTANKTEEQQHTSLERDAKDIIESVFSP